MSLEGDRAKTYKEVLNDTVYNAPVVKEVAIGVIGSEASERYSTGANITFH